MIHHDTYNLVRRWIMHLHRKRYYHATKDDMAKMDNTALTAMDAQDTLTTMMIFDYAVECVTPVERFRMDVVGDGWLLHCDDKMIQ